MTTESIPDSYGLSPLQQGMLFHYLDTEHSGVDIEQIVMELREPLNIAAFEQAWQRVAERHAVLRTAFRWERLGEPVQVVHRDAAIPLECHDWRSLTPSEQAERTSTHLRLDRQRGFDLRQAPLARLAAFRLEETAYRVVWTFHHILLDGRSFAILLKEVFSFYEAIARGQTLELAPTPSYHEYIEWINRRDLTGAEEFWRHRLKGFLAPTPLLPGRDAGEATSGESLYGVEEARLSAALSTALHSFAQREDLTLNTLIQGAWALLLSRYSGEEDVVFGATKTLRRSSVESADSMAGMFLNTLPVRACVPPDMAVRPWLKQLRDEWLSLRAFDHTPLARIKEWSDLPAGAPLFDSLLVFDNQRFDAVLRAGGEAWEKREFQLLERTNYSLTFDVYGGPEILLKIGYDSRRFERAAIRRMLGHLRTLLESMSSDPTQRLSSLPLLTEAERCQLLVEWNDTRTKYSADSCLHELIESQVERAPDNLALIYEDQELTYREMNARANQLAHCLSTLGVGPEVRVGLCVERSLEMALGVLGILKAGGAYVPLDPAYPRERLAFMLEDSRVPVLLTQERLLPLLPQHSAHVICLDRDWPAIAREKATNPRSGTTGRNLAYVIYTSGSTGRPKAAQLEHRGLCNLAETQAGTCAVEPGSRILQFCSLSFDPSIFDIGVTLCSGAALCLAPQSRLVPGPAMVQLLRDQAITMMTLPPSILAPLPDEPLSYLQTIVVGAEPCSVDVLRRWGHGRRFFNIYGATEATVFSTIAECHDNGRRPHIGRPIANTQIYLLDHNLQPVPVGIPGGLYIGGVGLARGYLNRPELTAEKFIPNPFSDEPGERLYETGDLARYLDDGNIEFLGRIDYQVKVHGYRIELEEIEAVLGSCPDVREAVVMAREDIPGEKRLVAYVVSKRHSVSAGELRTFLGQKLPDFMVPAAFVFLDALPLSPNGKVNRRALPPPERSAAEPRGKFVAPRTDLEIRLATIWAEVLGVDQVGIQDNFFDLGGDSILSIQVVGRANQAGIRLTPKQVFQQPTIAELAQVADMGRFPQGRQEPVLGPVPLTPIQHVFFELNLQQPQHWNQAMLFELKQRWDTPAIAQAIEALVSHYDALRLRFVHGEAGWQQTTAPLEENQLFSVVDLSNLARPEQARAMELAACDVQSSLNLSTGPLIRVTLFDLGRAQPSRLLIVIHHLAVDYISWGILLQDLQRAYEQTSRDECASLPPTTPFQHWAQRLAEYARAGNARSELDYWLAESRRCAVPLPVNHDGGPNTEASARTVTISLSAEETRALLREIPTVSGMQINDLLVTALAQTLTRWTGRPSVLVDLEGHGREELFEDVDLSRTVGWFTSIFPMLLDLEGADNSRAALRAVKEQLSGVPNHGVGHGVLRYLSGKEIGRQLSSLPRAQVSFNYLGQLDQILPRSETFALVPEPTGPSRSQQGKRPHLLDIVASITGGRLHIVWSYSENLHRRTTIERLSRNYLEALEELVAYCQSQKRQAYKPAEFPAVQINQRQLAPVLRAAREAGEVYPLSPMQQGMLFHSLRTPGAGVYVVQMSCTLLGNLNVPAFERAWKQVAERHAVLRTAFLWEGLDEPVQVVRQVDLPWKHEDWRGRSEMEQREHLEAMLAVDRQRGFVLAEAPLLRLTLIRMNESAHQFALSFHNLLLDGWSWPLVLQEALVCYDAYCQGQEPSLEPRRPYRDYISWLGHQDIAGAEAWWREELKSFTTPTRLGVDRAPAGIPKSETNGAAYAEQELLLSDGTTAALRSLAREQRLTLNTLLQGAWAVLLSRYSGEDDVVFGATLSGRSPALSDVDSMVGLLINTLPVRVQLPAEALLLGWLHDLQAHQAEMRQYEFSPLVEVQRWSNVPAGQALFDSIVVFQNYPLDRSVLEECGGLRITNMRLLEQTNYPLTLAATPGPRLALAIGYDCRRFGSATAKQMLEHLQNLLESMVANPAQRLSELSLLTSAERQRLVEWNQTRADYPVDRCIHQLFERQAQRVPTATAVVFEGTQLSYRELDERANQLGHYLRRVGVGPEVRVGICADRLPETLIGILGVLKAGGAYVPLDPNSPHDRLVFMLEDCQAPLLLATQRRAGKFAGASARVVCLDRDWKSISAESGGQCAGAASPDNLAYVIYTSGSTGRPKGVLVNHGNLVHSTCARVNYYQGAVGSFLLLSPFAFDSSLAGIFWTLSQGGRLVLPREGLERDPHELGRSIARKQISHLLSLPSLYDLLLEQAGAEGLLRSLDCVVVAGEPCPWELISRHQQLLPKTAIFNEYGPTEATVWSSVQVGESTTPNAPVPIGRPIPNARIYILDRRLEPVPIGLPGELYIGGAGVARGYLNQPELTAEKFIPDPFSADRGGRLYKTGDLGRYLADGAIEFVGRSDCQVKVRGYRVELEEIEAVLARHPAVRRNAVVAQEDDSGNKRLVAYFVPGENPPSVADLREFLGSKLPEYMLPSRFVALKALPVAPTGKVDRQALAALEPGYRETTPDLVQPRDHLEFALQQIWERVLGVRPIGITDNFFDLGGHSLLAVRLISQIQKALSRSIALSNLFQGPTIEQLAAALRRDQGLAPRPCTAIQPLGSKPPLFAVGSDPRHVLLAEFLGPDQPSYRLDVYALQEQQLVEGSEVYSEVEAIAARFVKDIQSVQPEGPYFLAGGCEGGIVAFEIARQLQAQGEQVPMLAIWQTPPAENWTWPVYAYIRLRRMARLLVQRGRTKLATLVPRRPSRDALPHPDADQALMNLIRLEHITISTVRAVRSYVSQPFDGRIILFLAKEQPFRYRTRAEEWDGLATGGLELHIIPGSHATYFEEHLADFGGRLKNCLDRAQRESSRV